VSGFLGLTSPWVRQAIQEPLRSELRSLVPDGWAVGVSSDAHHSWYRAWANHEASGRYARHLIERRSAETAIREVIAWINGIGHAAG
jgi:hypothetical protein